MQQQFRVQERSDPRSAVLQHHSLQAAELHGGSAEPVPHRGPDVESRDRLLPLQVSIAIVRSLELYVVYETHFIRIMFSSELILHCSSKPTGALTLRI